ncbi:MAG: hypothetical protein ACRDZ9_10075 [Acidimicrobiales bacterium]
MVELDELRERAEDMLTTRPAEVTPEASWLVAELEKNKQVIVGIIDYLLVRE